MKSRTYRIQCEKDLPQYHLATAGHDPIAAVITCADSRLSLEVVFRATLGQFFAIRIAGDTAYDCALLGSLDYNILLVTVVGRKCYGAMHAASSAGNPYPGALS